MEIQGTEEVIDKVIEMISKGTFVLIEDMRESRIPVIEGEREFR